MAHAFRIESTGTPGRRPRLTAVPTPVPCRHPDRRARRLQPDHGPHPGAVAPTTGRHVVLGVRVARGAVYTRRRILAAVVVALMGVGAWHLGGQVGAAFAANAANAADAAASPQAADAARVPGPGTGTVSVIVRPGDTVWGLAGRVTGGRGDPRPVVDAIVDHLGTAALVAGQRIELPASLAGTGT